MTYLDILSDSISHFTQMPKDYVVRLIGKAVKREDNGSKLLKMLMSVKLPDSDGKKIRDDLKSKTLENTIQYVADMMGKIRLETERQALMN